MKERIVKESEVKQRMVKQGGRLLVRLPRELDHHVATEIREEADRYLEAGALSEIVFDFSETEFMDSSGIGVIIGRSRKMKFLDGELVVCGVTPRIERIFEASGLYKIVKVRE